MPAHPDRFEDYPNIDAAKYASEDTGFLVHAWIGGKAYKIYPGGRVQRLPHEDKTEAVPLDSQDASGTAMPSFTAGGAGECRSRARAQRPVRLAGTHRSRLV